MCSGCGTCRARVCCAESGRSFWNCHAQQCRSFSSRVKLSIWQRRRDEKKFARAKIDIGAMNGAAETTNQHESIERRYLARRIQIPFLNFKKLMSNEQLSIRFD